MKRLQEQAAKLAATAGGSPFVPYRGTMVAGFNPTQNRAFAGINSFRPASATGGYNFARTNIAQGTNLGPQRIQDFYKGFYADSATKGAAGLANADIGRATGLGAQTVSGPGRIVDEGGRLGAINDYINPNLQSVLDPAIRDIQRAGEQQRNRIGAGAASAGAFGDSRHGVVEGQQYRGEQETIGDVSGQLRSQAWQDAMTRRENDLARMLGVEQFNAGAQETWAQRQLQGAGARMGVAGQQDTIRGQGAAGQTAANLANAAQQEAWAQRQIQGGQAGQAAASTADQARMAALMARLGIGQTQQNQAQNVINANRSEFDRRQDWPTRQLNWMLPVLNNGTATATTQGTTYQNSNPLASMLGAVGGTALNAAAGAGPGTVLSKMLGFG